LEVAVWFWRGVLVSVLTTRRIDSVVLRTQQLEEVLEDGHRIVVLDQTEQEACVDEVVATDEFRRELFLEVQVFEADIIW
jgi:hypothetical protein